MAKPEPYLLDPAHYPWRYDMATRFQDVDPNYHINNVATAALFEDLRVRYDWMMGLREAMERHGRRTMIVSLGIEYLGEMFYPEPVAGHCGVLSIGRSSWTIAGILVQRGAVGAFMRATLVCTSQGRPASVPDEFRAALDNQRVRTEQPVL